jgi:hypothetical protein
MSQRTRQLAVVLLLVVGVELFLFHGNPFIITMRHWLIALGIIIASMLPSVRKWVGGPLERLRAPAPGTTARTAIIIGLISVGYFYALVSYRHRPLTFLYHDEGSYLIQAQMLARGHLWMPAHAVAEAFETFHVFVKPVYASSYFPGTAILFVPGAWLGIPPWFTSLLLAGTVCGLLYYLTTRLVDGIAGLLSVLMLMSLPQVANTATQTLSHLAMAVLGLAVIWSGVRWRERPTWGRALVVGVVAGWAAITRPVDAIAFAAPTGIVMFAALLRTHPPRAWLTPLMIVVGAIPFLGLQLIANRGITGSWLKTPMALYIEQFHPGTSFGPGGAQALSERPQTTLPQKIAYYDRYIRPMGVEHQERGFLAEALDDRAGVIFAQALPSMLLLLLLPVGLAGLTADRAAAWAILPLYLLLYGLYAIFLQHYVVVVAPVVVFMVLLGKHVTETAWPRLRPGLTVMLTALVLVASLGRLRLFYPFEPLMKIELWVMEMNGELGKLVQTPALVLYNLNADGSGFHQEPVYNVDVAWPDDAPIVRAHNLGPGTTAKLIRYYAALGQDRHVYVMDRLPDQPHYRGTVRELVARLGPEQTKP